MKQRWKKLSALGLAAVVVATTAGMEYGTITSHAEEAAQTDTEKETLQEKTEGILNTNDGVENATGLYKDETVYVTANASGKVKKTIVSEWLKNAGTSGDLEDISNLKDIQNVKGEEAFIQGADGALTWKTGTEDIYYQGNTDAEAPVSVAIEYKLDGKKISPKKLKGKSGKVEMTITYTNTQKQNVDINGETVEMYTPFTMVTGTIMDIEHFSNVTVENGKLISEGSNNIVIGIGFPGLEEDLGLSGANLNIDIPDSVTIKADVKDFKLGPTMTVASAEIISSIGLDKIESFDDLEESLNQLTDATDQLVNGSDELSSKSGDLKNGIDQLSSGISDYTNGVSQVAEGAKNVKDGIALLKDKFGTAQQGVAGAKQGADQLAAGYEGNAGALAGAKSLAQGAGDLNTTVAGMAGSATGGLSDAQIQGILAAVGMTNTAAPEYQQAYAAIAEACKAQAGAMTSYTQKLADGSANLSGGVQQLYDGTKQLQSGLGDLNDGTSQLGSGVGDLYSGAENLENGAAKLNESSSVLTAGASKLKAGGNKLVDGTKTLANGMNEFKTTGIDKISNAFNGDIKGLTDRIDAMTLLGKNYKAFAGIRADMEGSTKFVIETAEIK